MLVWLCHLTQPHKHINGETVHIVHAPNAHTDGDALIFFTGANVIHMGDTFFNQRFPYVDIDAGGSVDGVTGANTLTEDGMNVSEGLKVIASLRQLTNFDEA